ncbi:MAG: bacteriocin fulvocin C-related protein, partial [Flavobacterium sp.]
ISLKFNYEKNISISSKTNIKSCNCKWTCSLYAGGGSKKCTETRSGCGFFWAFECDQRVGPTLEQIQPDTPDLEVETGLN